MREVDGCWVIAGSFGAREVSDAPDFSWSLGCVVGRNHKFTDEEPLCFVEAGVCVAVLSVVCPRKGYCVKCLKSKG